MSVGSESEKDMEGEWKIIYQAPSLHSGTLQVLEREIGNPQSTDAQSVRARRLQFKMGHAEDLIQSEIRVC